MDNTSLEIAKWLSGIIGSSVTVIIWVGNRQKRVKDRADERSRILDEKIIAMDRKSAEDIATIRENIQRLREKVESDRIDYKESLRQITDYMYNRPR